MPNVYDPRNRSGGKTMIRSRRRRKSPASAATAVNCQSNKNKAFIGDDLLQFCNSIENSTPSTKKQHCENKQVNKQVSPPTLARAPRPQPETESSSKPETTTTTISTDPLPRVRTALAVDTRFLAQEDKTIPRRMIEHFHGLLQSTMDRGIAPHILSWTHLQQSNAVKNTVRPKAQVVQVHSVCDIAEKSLDFGPVLIHPSSNNNNGNNEDSQSQNVFQVPKLLAANASWKLFGDFVESILQADTTPNDAPLDSITILTNDVSFVSDTRAKAHNAGLDSFWNRVKTHFLDSKIQSIRIVVLLTDAVEVVEDEQDVSLEDTRSRGLAIAECINAINQQIHKKVEAEFHANRSHLQFDASKHLPATNIALSTVDNSTVGLKTLLRTWSRERLQGSCRLTLDLPETMDSSQCSLALDAVYKSIPFRLDSQPARALQQDLELLGQAKLQVEKLVSIASLDASLLYGVPIRVRPGLESDIQSHNEMMLLVQSLFHQLSHKEYALVLASEGPQSSHEEGLFHSNYQTFVLMAEEIPIPLQETTSPSTGLLFRVASADHLMEEIGPADFISLNRKKDSTNPFADYVEQALDCLAYSDATVGYNPLYADAIKARPRRPSWETKTTWSESSMMDIWNDSSGVGASKAAVGTEQDLAGEKTEVMEETKWSNDTGAGSKATSVTGQKKKSTKMSNSKAATTEPYNSELDDDEYSPSQKKQRSIPIKTTRKKLAIKISSAPDLAKSEDDDVEWTDNEGLGFAPMGDSSSDSDDSNTKSDSVGGFDYSQ